MNTFFQRLWLWPLYFLLIIVSSCTTAQVEKQNQDDDLEAQVKGWFNRYNDIFVLDNPYFLEMQDLPVTTEQVSIIYFILQNTIENFSHRMREGSNNLVYISEDGHKEIVVDAEGNPVENYNAGTYNFFAIGEQPVRHFLSDRLPWILQGNSPIDETYPRERFWAYLQELNRGIQSYIFEGSQQEIPVKQLADFNEDERRVLAYFAFLLFQKDYAVQLTSENILKLIMSKDFYYRYYNQVLLSALRDRKVSESP